MNHVLKIKQGKFTYSVARASAAQQKTLMTLIAANVLLKSVQSKQGEINEEMIYGVLLTIGEPIFDQIVDLVLGVVVRVDQPEIPIDIESFQDHMHDYFMLIAKVIKENLQDFFTYLDEENAKNRNLRQLNQKS